MSNSLSSHPSPSRPTKYQNTNIDQNSKVYVSNIHRDAREEEITQLFSKFGQITYFAMKRKPEDVVYAFIQYNSFQEANQAVIKMNGTNFYKRTLNVQFGRGGKHQQQHYQTISIVSSRNRVFSERLRDDSQRRPSQKSQKLPLKQDKQIIIQKRSYRSPPPNQQHSRKQYKDYRPRQYNTQRQNHERRRNYDQKDSRGGYNDFYYRQNDKRQGHKYSPKRQGRPYQEDRKFDQRRRYDEGKHYERDEFYRRQKSGHNQYERRDKTRYQRIRLDERRDKNRYEQDRRDKSPSKDDRRYGTKKKSDQYQRNRDRFKDQRQNKRYVNERQRSPLYNKQYRSHKDQSRRPSQYYEQRNRSPERRQRREYQENRQYRRSRSRDRSPQKHKFHRRDRYEYQEGRRQSSRYQKQYQRVIRSPPRREKLKINQKRSYSPYNMDVEKKYHENNFARNLAYRNNQNKRYPATVLNKLRSQESNRQTQRGKGNETSEGYRKSSRLSQQSKSISPEKYHQKPQQNNQNLQNQVVNQQNY